MNENDTHRVLVMYRAKCAYVTQLLCLIQKDVSHLILPGRLAFAPLQERQVAALSAFFSLYDSFVFSRGRFCTCIFSATMA